MKIKAFGMDIQVTESAVFVNGKEVYNKSKESFCNELEKHESKLTKKDLEFMITDKDLEFMKFMDGMHNYSSGSSLIKPKDESEIDTPIIEVVDGNLKVVNQKYMSSDELIELSEAIQKEQRMMDNIISISKDLSNKFPNDNILKLNIDQAEQRMNVIGQNGNDGLHYSFWEEMNNDLMDNNRNEGVWDTDN